LCITSLLGMGDLHSFARLRIDLATPIAGKIAGARTADQKRNQQSEQQQQEFHE